MDTPAAAQQLRVPPVHLKPGSAGKPTPGFDVRIVDDDGRELPPGRMGNVVLALPLAPTAFRTLWRDDERYYRSYLARFGGRWLDTGDAGMVDEDGFVHIMARTDDVINVAGHRLSSGRLCYRALCSLYLFVTDSLLTSLTGAIEQALTSHPLVVEGCVVGIPDALKGHLPFAFVTLSASPDSAKSENATSKAEPPQPPLLHELNALVRAQVGPIATLGGVITAVPAVGDPNIIPRTRSGKTLRRTLRGLVEAAARRHGSVGLGSDPVDDAAGRQREEEDLKVPATIEDIAVIDAARRKVEEYFLLYGHRHVHDQGHHEEKAKL